MNLSRTILGVVLLGGAGCPQIQELDDQMTASVPGPVQAAFDRSCAMGGCHDEVGSGEMLSLTAGNSASVIGRQANQSSLPLVEIGSIENSYMAHKMLPDPPMPISGVRMPNGFSTDNETQVEDVNTILAWIAGAEFPGGDAGTGTDGGTTMGTDDATTGPANEACGIEDLKPGSPTDLIDAGDGAMQIPTEIGQVLANNCGCHYVDMLVRTDVADYFQDAQPLKITTWAEWQSMYTPAGGDPIPTLEGVRARVQDVPVGSPMPPLACDAGGGEPMTPADRALLLEWIDAGGPDGASWMGGGTTTSGGTTDGGSSTGGDSTGSTSTG